MGLKENIKKMRATREMTLEEVADKVGVSRQTVQKYESGVISNVPFAKIEKIAEALDTSPAYLMGWESIENTFPNNITENRLRMKLSLQELAAKLEIQKSTLYGWEEGTCKPNQSMIKKLCQVFGKTIDEMYGLSSNSGSDNISENFIDNDCIMKILGEAKELSPDGLNRLLAYAKKIHELEDLEQ